MSGLLILLAVSALLLLALLAAMLMREMRRPPRHTAAYALAKGLPCDPGELEPPCEFEEWTLELPDGAKLPVWEISNANARVESHSDLTIVFVHGWGHSRIDVLGRLAAFVPHYRRIVTYDLRGHGDSQNCLSNLGHDEHLDLLALLERLGDGRFVLVGHSMGAVIAMTAAAIAACERNVSPIANRIVGIVAYAPYCDFHTSLRGRLKVAGLPARPITDLALMALRWRGVLPSNLSAELLARLRCAVLLIHGDSDRVAPIGHSQCIADLLRSAKLHTVPGGAHTDLHLIDPEAHAAAIQTFFNRFDSTFTNEKAQACSCPGAE